MNRRGFLSSLFGGAVAALAVDPEKLLWVPGEKLISIPKPVIYRNTYLTVEMISYQMLKVLHNQTVLARMVNRDYERQFAGYGTGDTLSIRKPPKVYTYTPRRWWDRQPRLNHLRLPA